MKKIDLLGHKFGRLTVIKELASICTGNEKRKRCLWLCQCDCGNTVEKKSEKLRGGTLSCGCLHSESTARINYSHGMSQSSEHRIWSHIKNRCHNSNAIGYHNYGGRGIIVCDEWRNSFVQFMKDMGARPTKNHSIDRVDVNGNYEPNNCRWATPIEQGRNKRSTLYATYKGEKLPLKIWCEKLNINYRNAYRAMSRKGLTLEQWLTIKTQ